LTVGSPFFFIRSFFVFPFTNSMGFFPVSFPQFSVVFPPRYFIGVEPWCGVGFFFYQTPPPQKAFFVLFDLLIFSL